MHPLTKPLFFFITFCLFASIASGGDTFIRPRADLDVNIYNGSAFLGYTTGIEIGWKMNATWGIHIGTLYSARNYNFKYAFDPTPLPPKSRPARSKWRPYSVFYKINQLNIPIVVDFYWQATEKIKGYVGTGAILLFNLSERSHGERYIVDFDGTVDPGPYSYVESFNHTNTPYLPNYLGLTIQGGLLYDIGKMLSINPTLSVILPKGLGRNNTGPSATITTGVGLLYFL